MGHFARKKWMENRWRGGGQVKTGADGSIQAVIMETIVKVLAKITRHQEGISWRFMGKCG